MRLVAGLALCLCICQLLEAKRTKAQQKSLKKQQKYNFARKKTERAQKRAQKLNAFNEKKERQRLAKALAKQIFEQKKAMQKFNFDAKKSGLRDSSLHCVSQAEVSVVWSDATGTLNATNIQLEQFTHQGIVAVGTTDAHVGKPYMIILSGGQDNRIYAVEVSSFPGQSSMSSQNSNGDLANKMWGITDSEGLAVDTEAGLSIQLAYQGDVAGTEMTWYFCSSRVEYSDLTELVNVVPAYPECTQAAGEPPAVCDIAKCIDDAPILGCNAHDQMHCRFCGDGDHREPCGTKTAKCPCTCSNGVAGSGDQCPHSGWENCISCNTGYWRGMRDPNAAGDAATVCYPMFARLYPEANLGGEDGRYGVENFNFWPNWPTNYATMVSGNVAVESIKISPNWCIQLASGPVKNGWGGVWAWNTYQALGVVLTGTTSDIFCNGCTDARHNIDYWSSGGVLEKNDFKKWQFANAEIKSIQGFTCDTKDVIGW